MSVGRIPSQYSLATVTVSILSVHQPVTAAASAITSSQAQIVMRSLPSCLALQWLRCVASCLVSCSKAHGRGVAVAPPNLTLCCAHGLQCTLIGCDVMPYTIISVRQWAVVGRAVSYVLLLTVVARHGTASAPTHIVLH